jgi:tetratricopeptide (TPR) repeat protein
VTKLKLTDRTLHRIARLSLVGMIAVVSFGTAAQVLALSVQEIVTLSSLEIPDDQIIKKIQKDGTKYTLTPAEILDLKKKGVSDKVIRYMLSTSKEAGPAAGTAAGKAKGDDRPKRELTAAEQAAEEARLKEEALRLAEDQRRREDSARRAFAGKVLNKGQDLANDGKFVEAIQVFNKFVEDGVGGVPFAPDSQEAYVAKYGIANALSRAGLMQSAANALLDVVRAGPDKMFFVSAFEQLRELRRKINYRPPELEDLTRFSVVNAKPEFQDGFHYFVGEFLNDFGLPADAKPYLEKVSPKAEDYGRAQYLLGLIAFQDDTLSTQEKVTQGSTAFQKAVLAGEEREDGQPIVDLAYLALARLAYEYEQYDAAIYYYKKISKNSPKLASAFYEAGWTYFLKNDISRALGTFHALHSPYFSHHFYPELWILEATIYVNSLCQVESAEQAIQMFEETVLVLQPPLREFLKRNRRPEDFYGALLDSVNKKTPNPLPRVLQSPVFENVEYFNLYQTIKQIEKEEGVVRQNVKSLGPFGQDLLARLAQLKAERISEAGVVIQKTLRQTQKDLELYQDKLDELRIDLQEARLIEIDDKIAGRTDNIDPAAARQGAIAIAGSDSMVWPFQGEFWKDEIGAYRSFLRSKCRNTAE